MKLDVLDLKGKKIEDITVKDDVFKIEPNLGVLSQYIRVYQANQRQGTSSTKTRAEVRGGGKKPWRQKGTGRARHGSIRSPIWAHGGVAHGPKPKSWKLSFPKKMRKLAMRSALSQKAAAKKIFVVEKIDLKKPETKAVAKILEDLKITTKAIIVWSTKGENLVKSASNLDKCRSVFIDELGAYDLISTDSVIFTKEALTKVNERFSK